MVSNKSLAALFEPGSVAVIGASATPGKIGNIIVSNLLDAGYTGKIYPVNPDPGEILGLPVTQDVADLPEGLDLAVIAIPPAAVVEVMKDLAARKVKAVAIITAGFREVGREGYYLEEEIAKIARDNDIALLGPNCLGLIATDSDLNASFATGYPESGHIAFFSQSGALCVSILDWALGNNIGFSKFISLGNKAVLDESHMLDYLAEDGQTNVILGYIEGVSDGKRFMESASAMTMKKPVVMIKSGTTASGAKAASSHTGAIAGSDQAYDAAFRQTGVIRVHDVASLFNLATCFSTQPLPKGPNLAIITNSGGPGILAADATEKSGLNLSSLTARTSKALREFLPAYASLYNPIDIIGDASAERYARTLEVVAKDELVHAILVLLSPTASAQIKETAQAVIEVAEKLDKPVFACFMGDKVVGPGKRMLQDASIPVYSFPEPAIAGIEAMYEYHERRNRPAPAELCIRRDIEAARTVIADARERNALEIVEFQAQGLLNSYGLPVPKTELARTSQQAVEAAERIGYPVVLKIASPQISHKSDVGGVRVNLQDSSEVVAAFMDITSRAQRLRKDAFISGCLVQSMAASGSREVIVGFKRDDQFGPLIIFGLGGVYVEVLKDISARLAPLTLDDAKQMIREIKSFPVLRGVRGEQPVNFAALEEIILIMAQLALDFPEIDEAEFNPVLVNPDGAVVADVRVILAPQEKAAENGDA
ncbi:acetate--CoA ligase alpha subunit [Oceanidesulfovibrio marinus]|uniref:CoA-binding protein n=1 Tax=Oceanidesulfovibrio marinus TaxID=370038 RepID=A0A6P1ZN59_9BACT|nr:acetate--CoA ligase [Oceanidesulfovibrio marinus]TVM36724.1 CoA-binding protein [Oceanidesulfovibrio marinus]